MSLVLILLAALVLVYGIMAVYLHYGFKKKFSL
jgi:hypothetical protein